MDFLTEPSRWLQGFFAGFGTGACAVLIVGRLLIFFVERGMAKKTTKKRREIENGERCVGGILGCPGGKTCTSSHK